MSKQPCSFCGLPVRISHRADDQTIYCCSGCALAARIPTGDGNLLITRQLLVSLALAFGYFNQFLFWSLGFALRDEGRTILADRFDRITLAIGICVLIATVLVFLGARVYRWTDWAVLALVAGLVVLGTVTGVRNGLSWAVTCVLATNTLMVILLSRGWLKRALRKRRS